MKVYFISGLGADRRVFKNIQLPSYCEAVYLDWIAPLKDETLAGYALRLAQNINTKEDFSLIGLSLGGMMAVEIAKKYSPLHTILISSIPSSTHLPIYYKAAGTLQLHKLIPITAIQKTRFLQRFFTTKTLEEKQLLQEMVYNMDVDFIRWAINAILKWQNTNIPSSLIQIHGTHDEILPLRFTHPTHLINKAGHLMVMNQAAEINKILIEIMGLHDDATKKPD